MRACCGLLRPLPVHRSGQLIARGARMRQCSCTLEYYHYFPPYAQLCDSSPAGSAAVQHLSVDLTKLLCPGVRHFHHRFSSARTQLACCQFRTLLHQHAPSAQR